MELKNKLFYYLLKQMYSVTKIITHRDVQINTLQWPVRLELKLSFADGMIWVIPVFDTLENAQKFSWWKWEIDTRRQEIL